MSKHLKEVNNQTINNYTQLVIDRSNFIKKLINNGYSNDDILDNFIVMNYNSQINELSRMANYLNIKLPSINNIIENN